MCNWHEIFCLARPGAYCFKLRSTHLEKGHLANLHFNMFNRPLKPAAQVKPHSRRRDGRLVLVATIASFSMVGTFPMAHAAEPVVDVPTGNNAQGEPGQTRGITKPSPLLQVFTEFSAGYDDNSRTTSRSSGRGFTSEHLTLSYQPVSQAMQFSIVTGVGFSQYWGDRTDTHASFDLSLDRPISERLRLNASVNLTYTTEPNFASNIGSTQNRGSYFATSDHFSINYDITRRFAIVSSFSLTLVRYENSFTAAFTDRQDYTFGEQFRYALSRKTVLTADYRFLVVDFVTAPQDSTTHFVLAGAEHQFTPFLQGHVSAGVSFRSFSQGAGDEVNPDAEWALNYEYTRDTNLTWVGSYSVEQPSQINTRDRTTFRTGLIASHALTSRTRASLAVSYFHNDNKAGPPNTFFVGTPSNDDGFNVSFNVHYDITRRLGFNLNYGYSDVSSDLQTQAYSRNRYSLGISYVF
jgi:hypothetical protein